jgi:hypothetical protein
MLPTLQYFYGMVLRRARVNAPRESIWSIGKDGARRKLWSHFDNSKCQSAPTVRAESANSRCARNIHLLYSPDFAICDFCFFGGLKKGLQWLTIVREVMLSRPKPWFFCWRARPRKKVIYSWAGKVWSRGTGPENITRTSHKLCNHIMYSLPRQWDAEDSVDKWE